RRRLSSRHRSRGDRQRRPRRDRGSQGSGARFRREAEARLHRQVMETLGRFLDECAARAPEREAIAYAPQGEVVRRLSWREFREQSRLAAKRWLELGATKGSRLGLLCSNRAEW